MAVYIHQELDLGEGDAVEVLLDHWANVMLMDAANFARYERRQPYDYAGGMAKPPTLQITAPSAGRWHLVIDLGGYPGSVNPAVRVLHAA